MTLEKHGEYLRTRPQCNFLQNCTSKSYLKDGYIYIYPLVELGYKCFIKVHISERIGKFVSHGADR